MDQNRLIDALDRLAACQAPDAFWSCAAALLQDLGSDWATAGTAASTGAAIAVRTSTPAALMADYVGERLYLEDPWMAHCARSETPDRLDTDAAAPSALLGHRSRLARLFRDNGVRSAILIPCYGGTRTGGIVLYARSAEAAARLASPEGNAEARLVTALVAAHYRPDEDHSRSAGAYAFANPLSPREREALLWLSQGLQTSRIADRMGIREVTVGKHFATLRAKLGARTREQALAIAIRDRLIAP